MKILHSYLYKKGNKEIQKAIQGEAGESGEAEVAIETTNTIAAMTRLQTTACS